MLPELTLIAGADISFVKADDSIAVVCISILNFKDLSLVHSICKKSLYYIIIFTVTVPQPYIPGFLAFREAPALLSCLETLKAESPQFYPQLLCVDGNGTLHPRRFGSACHIGVLADLTTIGIAKNFLEIKNEGLLMKDVKIKAKELKAKGDYFDLVGSATSFIYGAALRSSDAASNPIFVSPGHRITLRSAISVVDKITKFRVPEPIRWADFLSREWIRKNLSSTKGEEHEEIL
ncbi:hypothetical protein HK096_000140 [Nowakowskiella sp. JEL0078]|nr:hypothetical protein HK096_000140 [Nowakowskiella sp. JEL0078]